MPPRKASAADSTAEETAPRRSGRIASQPKPAEVAPAKPKSTKGGKKRVADATTAEEGASEAKKAKGDEPEVTADSTEGKEAEPMKVDEDKADQSKPEESKPEESKADESKADEGKAAEAAEPAPMEDVVPDSEPEPAAAKLSQIELGDKLPSLVLKNEKDEDVDVSTLTGEKGLVLFLVPKADTPGCTTQACGFRDSYPDFEGQGFGVYCLSADTPAAQTKWQTKKSLPYPLLSDRKRVLIGALGAADGGKTKRSHFVFGKDGALLDRKLPVKPADSPKLALEFIKGLKSE